MGRRERGKACKFIGGVENLGQSIEKGHSNSTVEQQRLE